MQGNKLNVYRLFVTQEEIIDIAQRMKEAFEKNQTFKEIVYDSDFRIEFVLSDKEKDITRVTNNDNVISVLLTASEASNIAKKVEHVRKNAELGDNLIAMSYCDGKSTVLNIVAQQ